MTPTPTGNEPPRSGRQQQQQRDRHDQPAAERQVTETLATADLRPLARAFIAAALDIRAQELEIQAPSSLVDARHDPKEAADALCHLPARVD